MATTPHYIVKKVGDEYVTVPADNYPQMTKLAYTVWGGLIALHGLRRRGLSGLLMTGCGSWMAYTALQGRTPSLSKLLKNLGNGQFGSGDAPSYPHDYKNKSGQTAADHVDEAAMESFPASDPPARMAAAT